MTRKSRKTMKREVGSIIEGTCMKDRATLKKELLDSRKTIKRKQHTVGQKA
jgi:hypothetical protein